MTIDTLVNKETKLTKAKFQYETVLNAYNYYSKILDYAKIKYMDCMVQYAKMLIK